MLIAMCDEFLIDCDLVLVLVLMQLVATGQWSVECFGGGSGVGDHERRDSRRDCESCPRTGPAITVPDRFGGAVDRRGQRRLAGTGRADDRYESVAAGDAATNPGLRARFGPGTSWCAPWLEPRTCKSRVGFSLCQPEGPLSS